MSSPSPETQLIVGLMPLISGVVTKYIMDGLKRLSVGMATLSPVVKQMVVVLLAYGVTKLNVLLGINLPGDPTAWTSDVVNTLLTALAAFGVHNLQQTHTTSQ